MMRRAWKISWRLLIVILICLGFYSPTQADSGSASASMSLVVPSTDKNLEVSEVASADPGMSGYVIATITSLLERKGRITYKVWVGI